MNKILMVGVLSSVIALSACSSNKEAVPYTAKPFSETVYNVPGVKYNRVLNFGEFQVVEYQDLNANRVDPTKTVVVLPVIDKKGKGVLVGYTFDRQLVNKYITDPRRYVLTSSKAFDQRIGDDNPVSYVVGMEDVKYATMQVLSVPSYRNNKLFSNNLDTIAAEIQKRLNTLYPGAFQIQEVTMVK